jgi:creatinine amidohydrolase
MPQSVAHMNDMTWPQFAAVVDNRVLILPLGAIEQHGPHLPLDTDSATAVAMAVAVAGEVGGIVLPCFQYGYKSQPTSGGGRLFAGTTSLGGEAFAACVRDIVADLGRQGAQALLVLNANYENTMFAIEGLDLALERLHGAVPHLLGTSDPVGGVAAGYGDAPKAVLVNWWDQVRRDVLDRAFDGAFPGWEAEHAGVIETSLMLHLAPDRVALDRIESPAAIPVLPTYWVIPERPGMVPTTGILRTAEGSSAEIGRMLFDHTIEGIVAIVRRELGEYCIG